MRLLAVQGGEGNVTTSVGRNDLRTHPRGLDTLWDKRTQVSAYQRALRLSSTNRAFADTLWRVWV